MSSEHTAGQPLLVVIAPAAREVDAESVRIARDVLSGGAAVKVVVPESAAELDRVLSHRGRKQPVVIGDDRALSQVVQVLHRQRELASGPVGLVPVGGPATMALARSFGVPTEPVAAARTVLGGRARSLDLLVDDSGGVVLGGLRIPGRTPGRTGTLDTLAPQPGAGAGPCPAEQDGAVPPPANGEAGGCSLTAKSAADRHGGAEGGRWRSLLTPAGLGRTARTVARVWTGAVPGLLPSALPNSHTHRLRVEADGTVLADIDRPVSLVAVRLAAPGRLSASRTAPPAAVGDGSAEAALEVLVRLPPAAGRPLRVRAHTVTVAGRAFSYEADSELAGPVRSRTWSVLPHGWRLTVPLG